MRSRGSGGDVEGLKKEEAEGLKRKKKQEEKGEELEE